MYVHRYGLHYIMYCRKYDVSFTSSKSVNASLYFPEKEDQFPCKILGSIVHTVYLF